MPAITIDDYEYRPRFRHSHPKIETLIAAGSARYKNLLTSFLRFEADFARIPVNPIAGDHRAPHWLNGWLPAFDSLCLYGMVATLRPARIIEVGSGHSTRFIRRAIEDARLNTHVVSIDPTPRAEIDAVCDTVIRMPLEDADVSIFSQLQSGDLVFVDNSHRSFQNSDTTVFFTDVLPSLPTGVTYGIHDIFLPFDYGEPILSPEWPDSRLPQTKTVINSRFAEFIPRYYNEQYLLAAYLLGGAAGDEIVLPCAWATSQVDLLSVFNPIWDRPGFSALEPWGGAFWAKRG